MSERNMTCWNRAQLNILKSVATSLASAISIVEAAEAEKAPPSRVVSSDSMFKQHISDFHKSLAAARTILAVGEGPERAMPTPVNVREIICEAVCGFKDIPLYLHLADQVLEGLAAEGLQIVPVPERFSKLSDETVTIPDGYSAPLDTRTSREMIVERVLDENKTAPDQPAPYRCKHGCERDEILDKLAASEAEVAALRSNNAILLGERFDLMTKLAGEPVTEGGMPSSEMEPDGADADWRKQALAAWDLVNDYKDALKKAQPIVCSMTCKSHGRKSDMPWPHSPICEEISKLAGEPVTEQKMPSPAKEEQNGR